ncbi:MAG: hypothetical protein AMXMBFR84_14530 [Candidatus Hydrogenedentota bacterium]
MPIERDDIRLTEYALGELPEDDRVALEELIADDPDAQKAVKEIQAAAKLVEVSLAGFDAPELESAQRQEIIGRVGDEDAPRLRIRWFRPAVMLRWGAAAAVLVFAGYYVLPRTFNAREVPVASDDLALRYQDRVNLARMDKENVSTSFTGPDDSNLVHRIEQNRLAEPATAPPQDAPVGDLFILQEGLTVADSSAESSPAATSAQGAETNWNLSASGEGRVRELEVDGSSRGYFADVNGDGQASTPSSSTPLALLPTPPVEANVNGATPSAVQFHSKAREFGGGGFGGQPGQQGVDAGQGGSGGFGGGGISVDTLGTLENRPALHDDVDVYQAYIESANGMPGRIESKAKARSGSSERLAEGKVLPLITELGKQVDPLSQSESRQLSFGLNFYSNSEAYAPIVENPFLTPMQNPLSTFSIDVDTASYSNTRRFLNQGQLPPPDAVRIEELVNYFDYEYAGPTDGHPFAAHVEVAPAPWKPEHRLVRVGIKGKDVPMDDRAPANLVFLIDVSGSMEPANKLPLLKEAMLLLARRLSPQDRVGIVTYAGAAGIALESTSVDSRETILSAVQGLSAGGSTNGEGGIRLAYDMAQRYYLPGGVNRVILCTDGDFNVGVTDTDQLVQMVREKAGNGIFLSILGFGMDNIKDDRLEQLSNKGNGAYYYIDNFGEAQRVLVEDMAGTLVTIAKDVKIQIEFNPGKVQAYRLIGYENRALAAQDFNDDRKDAGEIGAGHTVTALYEIVPAGVPMPSTGGVDPLRYSGQPEAVTPPPVELKESAEMLFLRLRYKEPEGTTSKLIEVPVTDHGQGYDQSSREFRWAAAVAAFGMELRNSQYKGNTTLSLVQQIAEGANGYDINGRRSEFLSLVVAAKNIKGQ